jgi:quinoprotein glucose dehydrogenase
VIINIKHKGCSIPAVAARMGDIFVLHRETGKSLVPIEKRAVLKSNVSEEQTSLTQPISIKSRLLVSAKRAPEDT